MLENKLIKISLFISVVFAIGLFFLLKSKTSTVFPANGNDVVFFDTYHEAVDTLFSESSVVLKKKKDKLLFTYSLSKNINIQEPFSALFFYKNDTVDPFFDLSSHNIISLNLSSFRGKRIPITFTLNYEGFTDEKKILSNLPMTYVLEYKSPGFYHVKLDQFEIPSWWLRQHKLKKEDLNNIKLSRVNYIVIGSCQLIDRGVEDEIIISYVGLKNDNSIFFIIFGIALLFVFILFLLIHFLRKRKVVIPYSQLEIIERYPDSSSKVEAVVVYMARHYSKPELSLIDVQKETGISSREIGLIFKNQFGSSFKKYLNLMRLTEVKRLLKETNETISVIAYKTGYSNVSHFNRVFKSEEGMSPKDYREKLRWKFIATLILFASIVAFWVI